MPWIYGTCSQFSDSDYDEIEASLSPTRRARITRFRQPDDRKRSLAGEQLMRILLEDEYGIPNVVLHCDERGKPFLEDTKYHISIAHCDDRIVCAADTQPIGIDIERIRPIRTTVIRRVCTADEQRYVYRDSVPRTTECTDVSQLERFFEIWTAKEAFFKKVGTGITNFQSVDIYTLQREQHRLGDYVVQLVY